ncbi:hypothetical protein Tco_0328565 [Tanacetum coccineum]
MSSLRLAEGSSNEYEGGGNGGGAGDNTGEGGDSGSDGEGIWGSGEDHGESGDDGGVDIARIGKLGIRTYCVGARCSSSPLIFIGSMAHISNYKLFPPSHPYDDPPRHRIISSIQKDNRQDPPLDPHRPILPLAYGGSLWQQSHHQHALGPWNIIWRRWCLLWLLRARHVILVRVELRAAPRNGCSGIHRQAQGLINSYIEDTRLPNVYDNATDADNNIDVITLPYAHDL